jgi:GNAT superfamily N-acetyltransferase
VGRIKSRQGVGTWAIADGGAGTVAFPLFYEIHEILHARTPEAAPTHRYDLVGGACFSADWLYRGIRLPKLQPGDILAVCDAGAYFSVQESNFGFAHPPIVAVREGVVRLLRRRESWPEMISRDVEAEGQSESPPRVGTAARGLDSPVPGNGANGSSLKFRRLTAADVNEAASIFALGFNDHELFSPALGLERTTFGAYFGTLIPLALNDPRGVVLGADWNGRLAAVLIAARPGFPNVRGGLRHLGEFARIAGWGGLIRYLAFSHQLERFLHRPKAERQTEFRGLWLAANRNISGQRAGAFLVRAACDYSRRIGYPLQAAVVDGANKPLVAFYERQGFRVVPGGSFLGGRAVRMEHRLSNVALHG